MYNKSKEIKSFKIRMENCAICMNDYEDQLALNPCRHKFCKKCIMTWLEKNPTCPLCRCKCRKLWVPRKNYFGNEKDLFILAKLIGQAS